MSDLEDFLEEDYEAHHTSTRPDPFGPGYIPVGCCDTMCTTAEAMERENQQRLSKYETVPNSKPPRAHPKLIIKEFRRSCVGREFTSSLDLRPWSVLKQVLDRLLLDICLKNDDWLYICDFVFDRLKAVRQDMVIQRIEGRRYITMLEGSIRFMVYSMYRLTCTLEDFSLTRHLERIVNQDGPVTGLSTRDLAVVSEMKITMKCLRDCLNSLIIQYQENVPKSPNRALFESINLIVNLPFLHGHRECSTDFQAKSELRNSSEAFQIIFKMYREHLSGNHWAAISQIPRFLEYPLIILAYAPVMAQLQVHLIQLFKKAYSSPGTNKSSFRHLAALICPDWLDCDEEMILNFTRFIAIQFDVLDDTGTMCDWKHKVKEVPIPRDFQEKARLEQKKLWSAKDSEGDNETRIYALQMVAGRNWEFYQELVKLHGLRHILDPYDE